MTPEQRLIHRVTMGWTAADQAHIDEIGYDAYLAEQLDFGSFDTSELEARIESSYPAVNDSPRRLYTSYAGNPEGAARQLFGATLWRSALSPRQLYERMVVFWSDHFSIDVYFGDCYLWKIVDDREVIRRYALARFPDLLMASAKSPAMLHYLTNDLNEKSHPNENYARELMELHTLGADSGYTQRDVVEVARAFTGWSVARLRRQLEFGEFVFNEGDHDSGAKRVLGEAIPAGGGIEDGERVVRILAEHPNTARFIARKLLRYMWGYEPPEGMVERVASKYLETGGNIRSMLRVILRRAWMAEAPEKLKRPYHLLTSAIRALGAEVPDPVAAVLELVATGHVPFTWSPPNGFPDSEGYWAGNFLPRLNLAARLPDRGSGVGYVLPAALDPDRNAELTGEEVRGRLNRDLTGRTLGAPTKTVLRDFLAAGELTRSRVLETIGLIFASPEFQRY